MLRTNLHADKRILKCQPFSLGVYVTIFSRKNLSHSLCLFTQDRLEATLKIIFSVDEKDVRDWELPVRLGCPLVSSVFVMWDWWITCKRLPAVKCTQV